MAPPKDPAWIPWLHCSTKLQIIEDLVNGDVPSTWTAKQAWETRYRDLDVVKEEKVVFSQFEKRWPEHIKQVGPKKKQSIRELKAFRKHQRLHPSVMHKLDGKPHFDKHPAKQKLREDVEEDAHKEMAPSDLRETDDDYKAFAPKDFRSKIYQTVRAVKFNTYLNDDRNKKEKDRKEKNKKAREAAAKEKAKFDAAVAKKAEEEMKKKNQAEHDTMDVDDMNDFMQNKKRKYHNSK